MYRDDIKDLIAQKRESNRFVLTDFILLYIKMSVYVPDYVEERNALVRVVGEFFRYDSNESEVLNTIKKMFGKVDDDEDIDEMLEQFDDMAQEQYDYFQKMVVDYADVLDEYSSFFEYIFNKIQARKNGERYAPGDIWRRRMIPRKIEHQVFNEEFKYDMLDRLDEIAKSR